MLMTQGTQSEVPPRAARQKSWTHGRPLILVVLSLSLLIVSLDTTVLNVALPEISRELRASSSQLQWIVDAYVVVFAGMMIVLGSLGDRLGRKWIFMAGLAVFACGSVASAFSGSPGRLIAARAVMGLGAAAIMPATLSILTNVFSGENERARAIGVWSGTSGLGVAIGPVVGGWLLSRFWWGSVFLVNVPIAIAALLATALVVPNSRDPMAKRADPVGAVLSMVGMGSLLWGIIEAPARGWTSPEIIGALALGATLLGAFVVWELRSSHPLLEISLFSSRRFSVAMGALAFVMFALMGCLFLLTQYLQFSLGYTALQAGVRVLPIAGTLLVVSPLSALLARWIGTKLVVFAGMSLIATGLALVSGTTIADGYVAVLPSFLLIGIGTGLCIAPCTESVMGSADASRAGVASATNGAALQTGGALGVAVLGSLLNSRYTAKLAPVLAHRPIPSAISQLIIGSLAGALAVAARVGGTLGAELSEVARSAFVSGMDLAVTVAACVVAAASVGVLLLLPSRADRHVAEDPEHTRESD